MLYRLSLLSIQSAQPLLRSDNLGSSQLSVSRKDTRSVSRELGARHYRVSWFSDEVAGEVRVGPNSSGYFTWFVHHFKDWLDGVVPGFMHFCEFWDYSIGGLQY